MLSTFMPGSSVRLTAAHIAEPSTEARDVLLFHDRRHDSPVVRDFDGDVALERRRLQVNDFLAALVEAKHAVPRRIGVEHGERRDVVGLLKQRIRNRVVPPRGLGFELVECCTLVIEQRAQHFLRASASNTVEPFAGFVSPHHGVPRFCARW
jgi:hypothetical protein